MSLGMLSTCVSWGFQKPWQSSELYGVEVITSVICVLKAVLQSCPMSAKEKNHVTKNRYLPKIERLTFLMYQE